MPNQEFVAKKKLIYFKFLAIDTTYGLKDLASDIPSPGGKFSKIHPRLGHIRKPGENGKDRF